VLGSFVCKGVAHQENCRPCYGAVEEAITAGVEDAAAGGGGGESASMMTVRVLVAVRPLGSVATY
jgi:hypothetical protein